jgi:rubrerythrin
MTQEKGIEMQECLEAVYICYGCLYSISGYSRNGLMVVPDRCPSCDAEVDLIAFSSLFEEADDRGTSTVR